MLLDQYTLVLGQNGAILVVSVCELSKYILFTWCKPSNHSIFGAWYLVLGGTGSEQGSTGCQCDMLSENIWLHGVNHEIIQYSEKEKLMTDRQMDRQTDRQTEFTI